MMSFEILDLAFGSYFLGNAPVKKLAAGFDWAEAPVWFGDPGCLLFSDIPNYRILRWTSSLGISSYREPSNYANGHTRDRVWRLISCEHGLRRVTRTEQDGRITVIVDDDQVKPLNSLNYVVVKSDGSIWFTDLHYGILSDYERHLAADGVHCIAPDGHLMGKILVPEVVSNICFGGRAKHQSFITATTSFYAISLNRNGAQTP